MATPEKSGPEEQKSTPGRIKKEEYVLFKKSTPSAAKGKIFLTASCSDGYDILILKKEMHAVGHFTENLYLEENTKRLF